ncbi:hypothetical protein C8R46DRAFT_1024407 [Mycena filopes]|nr:hypothetical protein C8R46DRAFT_1024407 [Mycena filopes]
MPTHSDNNLRRRSIPDGSGSSAPHLIPDQTEAVTFWPFSRKADNYQRLMNKAENAEAGDGWANAWDYFRHDWEYQIATGYEMEYNEEQKTNSVWNELVAGIAQKILQGFKLCWPKEWVITFNTFRGSFSTTAMLLLVKCYLEAPVDREWLATRKALDMNCTFITQVVNNLTSLPPRSDPQGDSLWRDLLSVGYILECYPLTEEDSLALLTTQLGRKFIPLENSKASGPHGCGYMGRYILNAVKPPAGVTADKVPSELLSITALLLLMGCHRRITDALRLTKGIPTLDRIVEHAGNIIAREPISTKVNQLLQRELSI